MKKLLLLALFLVASSAYATDRFVGPGGSGTTCTIGSPGAMGTGITMSTCAGTTAGDTIWLRAGTYTGCFTFSLTGTTVSPIIVRNYQNEHVTFDGPACGGGGGVQNLLKGSYWWLWGVEVLSSGAARKSAQAGSFPTDVARSIGIYMSQDVPVSPGHPGIKVINCIIHDTAEGMGWWVQAVNSEVYGTLIYYNGWDGPDNDRTHGHGIYAQNDDGSVQTFRNNLIAYQANTGVHWYGSSDADLKHGIWDRNAVMRNAGQISTCPCIDGRDVLFDDPNDVQFTNNLVVQSSTVYSGGSSNFRLGYSNPSTNCIFTNNKVYSGTYFSPVTPVNGQINLTNTGNVWQLNMQGWTSAFYPSNTYISAIPTVDDVMVNPNAYETGRCHIWAVDWDGNNQISANISTCGLADGGNYEIRSAFNFYAAPFTTGTYSAASPTININTAGYSMAAPIYYSTPPVAHQFMMILLPTAGGAATATPTLTPTFTLTPSNTPTLTPSLTWTPTNTFTATATWTPSNTPVLTSTNTNTPTRTNTATATFTASPTFTPQPTLSTTFEAEACTPVAPMAINADVAASGGFYVSSSADGRTTPSLGGTLTCTVTTGAGVYRMWANVEAPDNNSDSMYFELDNEGVTNATHIWDMAESQTPDLDPTAGCHYLNQPGPNYRWNKLNWREGTYGNCAGIGTERQLTLTAGPHVFRFYGREIGARLDKVILTTDLTYDPSQTTSAGGPAGSRRRQIPKPTPAK